MGTWVFWRFKSSSLVFVRGLENVQPEKKKRRPLLLADCIRIERDLIDSANFQVALKVCLRNSWQWISRPGETNVASQKEFGPRVHRTLKYVDLVGRPGDASARLSVNPSGIKRIAEKASQSSFRTKIFYYRCRGLLFASPSGAKKDRGRRSPLQLYQHERTGAAHSKARLCVTMQASFGSRWCRTNPRPLLPSKKTTHLLLRGVDRAVVNIAGA